MTMTIENSIDVPSASSLSTLRCILSALMDLYESSFLKRFMRSILFYCWYFLFLNPVDICKGLGDLVGEDQGKECINSALCVSTVLLSQSAASPHFPCLFLSCSSRSSCCHVSCQSLLQLSFSFPNIILACLDNVSAFLLCSISPCFHLFSTFFLQSWIPFLAKPDSLFIYLFSSVLWWTVILSVGGCL